MTQNSTLLSNQIVNHPIQAPAVEHSSEKTNADYGVSNEFEEANPDMVIQDEEEENTISIEDERCYHFQLRNTGIFRKWLPAFFVLNPYSICSYPNEKRYEKKKKEIILYDASISVINCNNYYT